MNRAVHFESPGRCARRWGSGSVSALVLLNALSACGGGGTGGASASGAPGPGGGGSFPVNEGFAAELVGKGAPEDVARFFAAAKVESSNPDPSTFVYRQTFPNGATREMTLTLTRNQQYTPTPEELAAITPDMIPLYSFTYASSVQPDDGSRTDLSYFVHNEALPVELRAGASSTALTAVGIGRVAQALDGPLDGAGVGWEETGKKATDWSIGSALELAAHEGLPVEALSSIYALASALSDVSQAMDLSTQINQWLAELDALEKCAANPTNPLSKSDPSYSKDAVAKVQEARRELKQVSAVRFLNVMTETGSGITPASAALAVGLKSGFQWNEQTLSNYSKNTIMREAKARVVPCDAGQTGWQGTFEYTASASRTVDSVFPPETGVTQTRSIVTTVDGHGSLQLVEGSPGSLDVSTSSGDWTESNVDTLHVVDSNGGCVHDSTSVGTVKVTGPADPPASAAGYGTITVSGSAYHIHLPTLDGTATGTVTALDTVVVSGGCSPGLPYSSSLPTSDTIPSNSLDVDGTIDPSTPDEITGSTSIDIAGTPTVAGPLTITYAVSWDFKLH